jgi:hypothetical protein
MHPRGCLSGDLGSRKIAGQKTFGWDVVAVAPPPSPAGWTGRLVRSSVRACFHQVKPPIFSVQGRRRSYPSGAGALLVISPPARATQLRRDPRAVNGTAFPQCLGPCHHPHRHTRPPHVTRLCPTHTHSLSNSPALSPPHTPHAPAAPPTPLDHLQSRPPPRRLSAVSTAGLLAVIVLLFIFLEKKARLGLGTQKPAAIYDLRRGGM